MGGLFFVLGRIHATPWIGCAVCKSRPRYQGTEQVTRLLLSQPEDWLSDPPGGRNHGSC
jgi:hypothetical protein